MVQSKVTRPDWLPAVGLCSALVVAMLLWDPQVGDLAAQVFRTQLFDDGGLSIWNGSWYGGHYTLTYSVLFPPLAALLSPQVVGSLAVVSSAYLFDRIVRDRWGAAARLATLWFAAGVVTLLADGQLTFSLGVAFGLGALRALQLGYSARALLASAACALSSPVAAVFLAGILIAGSLPVRLSSLAALRRGFPRRRADSPTHGRVFGPSAGIGVAAWAAALALGLTVIPNLVFPGAGQFPFVFSSYVAIPLWGIGALYLTRDLAEEEWQLRQIVVGYVLGATVIWLIPNAMGGNAVRLGALFGGPVLAAVLLARRPQAPVWLLALFLAGSLYWQLTASVTQIARTVGDPSTEAAYFEPVGKWLRDRGGKDVRVEVPPTKNHWESAYLAPEVELARGWLRQLDTTRENIFYTEGALTHSSYAAWLRANAISYVALPDAALDYSSIAERALILSNPPYLDLAWQGKNWQVFEVRGAAPLVEPRNGSAARVRNIAAQSFSLDVTRPGEFLVRVRFTPYWSIARGKGCLLRRGEWTLVRAHRPGLFRVAANFSLPRAWNAVTGARKTC